MEEKKLTDQESLELISQLIRSTRENMEVGRGNLFLYFGYFSAFLGIAIYILTALTSNGVWGFGWFLMFAFWGSLYYFSKKPAVTQNRGQGKRIKSSFLGIVIFSDKHYFCIV